MESVAVGELSPQPQAHSTANDVCIALQREKETLERKLQTLEQEVKKREAVFVQEQSILNRRIKDFEEKEKKDKESKEKLLNLVSRSEEQQQVPGV